MKSTAQNLTYINLKPRLGSEEEGQPATASPHVGSATHSQAECKGQPTTVKCPCKGATSHGQSPLQGQSPAGMAGACRGGTYGRRQHPQPGRRGQLPAVRPQGQPRGQGCRLQGRLLLQGQRPRKAALPAR
ncbi:hypothetical protein GW17_00016086 [Ensete ventricosum]|nr:hypothetical protein GW17_00016086 [Ensete ventricosum]